MYRAENPANATSTEIEARDFHSGRSNSTLTCTHTVDLQVLIHNFIQEQIAFHRKAADTWDSLVIDFEGDESSASP